MAAEEENFGHCECWYGGLWFGLVSSVESGLGGDLF